MRLGTPRHLSRTTLGRAIFALALAALAALAGVAPAAGQEQTSRGGRPTTVRTTINIPSLVVENRCNRDVVNLSGDMDITTTTWTHAGGGSTVISSAIANDLRGPRIDPAPAIGYRGFDRTYTHSMYRADGSSTHRVLQHTSLVPEGAEPSMHLVTVLVERVAGDGTVKTVLERPRLTCRPRGR